MSEAEFLEHEEKEVRTAISHAMSGLARDTGRLIDPRWWTRAYPKSSLGAALVAGFATAAATIPAREREISEGFFRRVADAVTSKVSGAIEALHRSATASSKERSEEKEKRSSYGWIWKIAAEALSIVRPFITNIIAARMMNPADADGSPPPSERSESVQYPY